jgi:hypothetical protein
LGGAGGAGTGPDERKLLLKHRIVLKSPRKNCFPAVSRCKTTGATEYDLDVTVNPHVKPKER